MMLLLLLLLLARTNKALEASKASAKRALLLGLQNHFESLCLRHLHPK